MLTLSRWDTELDYETTLNVLGRIAQKHCEDAGIIASEIAEAYRSGDYRSVCSYSIDYALNWDVMSLIHVRQALALVSKLEQLDIGVDKEAVAIAAFAASELRCKNTNAAFRAHASGVFCFPQDVEKVLYLAQRKIARVLGDVPSINSLELKFGPGATSSIPKKYACTRVKLSSKPTCSSNMVGGVVQCLLEAVPHYAALHATSEDDEHLHVEVSLATGRLVFVPKNAKTYRGVRPEPTLNALLQSGYGKDITAKLLRVGIDLSDQSRNQRLARLGSLTGDLATLDLSSASDSISTELVAHLLPFEWFSALSSCRTPTCELPSGETHTLEQFSGMGNGFTFPLQSLIFWALVDAACDVVGIPRQRIVSVYGDDIIAPTDACILIQNAFDSVGFVLNTDKSYTTGPFRESCGKDYYNGIDVRPYYQKELISGVSLFALHNHYVRAGLDTYAAMILEYIPEHLQIFGPDGFGDGHLLGDWIPKPFKRSEGWGGHTFDTFTKIGKSHKKLLPGDRVLPHYSVYAQEPVPLHRNIRGLTEAPLALTKHQSSGVPLLPLPGTKGYKRISIYTLET